MSQHFASHPRFRYKYLDSTRGTRVQVISCDWQPFDFVSVSVSVDFGSKHLECVDENGVVESFPLGMAHFMEHFLFWLCYDEVLIPLSLKYAHDPNAVVTYDKTVWGLQGAWASDASSFRPRASDKEKVAALYDITERLLGVLNAQPADKIESLMAKTKNDVEQEIGYRHTEFSYPMKLELLASLYREAPVRHDILGTSESLQEITGRHIHLALKLIRTNIKSIIVQGHQLSDAAISEIQQSILTLITKQPAEPGVRPVTPPIESLEVNRVSSGLRPPFNIDSSEAILGLKLPPLQESFSAREDLKRIFLIGYLARHYVRGGVSAILSPTFRTYFMAGNIDDAWFYWDKRDLYRAINDLKVSLVLSFEEYRRFFAKSTELAFARILEDSHGLMKLCHAANVYQFDLNELFGMSLDLRPEDLDRLIAELRDTKGNASLVYTKGPE